VLVDEPPGCWIVRLDEQETRDWLNSYLRQIVTHDVSGHDTTDRLGRHLTALAACTAFTPSTSPRRRRLV